MGEAVLELYSCETSVSDAALNGTKDQHPPRQQSTGQWPHPRCSHQVWRNLPCFRDSVSAGRKVESPQDLSDSTLWLLTRTRLTTETVTTTEAFHLWVSLEKCLHVSSSTGCRYSRIVPTQSTNATREQAGIQLMWSSLAPGEQPRPATVHDVCRHHQGLQ